MDPNFYAAIVDIIGDRIPAATHEFVDSAADLFIYRMTHDPYDIKEKEGKDK